MSSASQASKFIEEKNENSGTLSTSSVNEAKVPDLSVGHKDMNMRLQYSVPPTMIPSFPSTAATLEQETDIDPRVFHPGISSQNSHFRRGSFSGARRGDFDGDLIPNGGSDSSASGMLLGPFNFPTEQQQRKTNGIGPRFDPPGPFGVGGDPDNDIFRPPGGPGAPHRNGPSII